MAEYASPAETPANIKTARSAASDARRISKKRYNNVVSAMRCAFEYGYKDLPGRYNPGSSLGTLRITKKDRAPIDPFSIHDG